MFKAFTHEETRELALRLEEHHAIFSQLWQISTRVYDDSIKTACVSFDDVGQVTCLSVNPKFWEQQSATQKEFIMCHEMLHVLLEHGRRVKDAVKANQPAINATMDVVVNELLVGSFGFKRKDIDPKDKLCWISTVFPKRKDVVPNQTFEYYFNRLPKKDTYKALVLDDHSKLGSGDISKMAEWISSKLSPDEKRSILSKLGKEAIEVSKLPGTEAGGLIKAMAMLRVRRQPKFETLIKTALRVIADSGIEETWITALNRRISTVHTSKVILPTEVDGEGIDKRRALIYFFLDTSGSCAGLADRFWRLALSVPRDVFDVRLRCFDTRVYEVSLKEKKLYGFGGTSFAILEQHIQAEINGGKYPDGVFIVTDGYGDSVVPVKPEKWHVLLTTPYKTCFPDKVNFYDLAKFE